jgi:hypothetical protein
VARLTNRGLEGICRVCGKQTVILSVFVNKLDGDEIPPKKNGSQPMWQVCEECIPRLDYDRH